MPLSEEDKALFREAVANVTPIKNTHRITQPPLKTLKKPKKTLFNDAPKTLELANCENVLPESYLSHQTSGLHNKQWAALKNGNVTIDHRIDLHGETEDSTAALLAKALNKPVRTLLIIHGKGQQAILKNYVNRVLRVHPRVLAFCSAPARLGGTGAIVCLLKRTAKKDN